MPHSDNSSKSIVVSAIEEALNELSNTTFETVVGGLYQKYRCLLTDCYEKPEYLKEVLKELYGNDHIAILESIKKHLEKDLSNKTVFEYYTIISSMLK